MNLTYTPEQCQAARLLEDDIIQLRMDAEKLRFLVDVLDSEVFDPARIEKKSPASLVHAVKYNAPGIDLADDCITRMMEVLERMNQGIRQSKPQ